VRVIPTSWRRLLRRRVIVIGIAVVVIAAAVGGWLLFRQPESAAAVTTTATVARGTVKQTVAASGTVEAARSADESFSGSGTVTHVYVAAGDHVRKGERLAAIDASTLSANRAAAASELSAAQAQLSQDQSDGADDVQLSADRAGVSSADAALAQADDALEGAVLRATIAGTVTSVGVEVGDVVGGSSSSGVGGSSGGTSSSSSTGSTSAVSIVSGNHYEVDADLAASDAGKVEPGMQATISVTGVDATVYGTVRSVSQVAETGDSGAAVFPVVIDVTGAQKDLYAGVSASATITTLVRQNVLTVDTRAVHSDSSGTYVNREVDGRTVRTDITIGDTYGLQTEVKSGLAAGDVVQVVSIRLPSGGGSGSGNERGGSFPAGGFPGGGTGFGGGSGPMIVQGGGR